MKYEITIRNTETDETKTAEAEALFLIAFSEKDEEGVMYQHHRFIAEKINEANIAWAILHDKHLENAAKIALGYQKWWEGPGGLWWRFKNWLDGFIRGKEPGDSGA